MVASVDNINIEIGVDLARLNAAMNLAEQRVAQAARRMDRDMRLTVLPSSTGLLQVHGGAATAFGGFLSASQLQAMREHQAMVKNLGTVMGQTARQMNQPVNERGMMGAMFLGGQGFAKGAAGVQIVRSVAEGLADASEKGMSFGERVTTAIASISNALTFGVGGKLRQWQDRMSGEADTVERAFARAERRVARVNTEMGLLAQRRESRFERRIAEASDPVERAMAEAAQRQGQIRMERQELYHRGIVSKDFEEAARNREWIGRAESVRSMYGPVPSRYVEQLWQQIARSPGIVGTP